MKFVLSIFVVVILLSVFLCFTLQEKQDMNDVDFKMEIETLTGLNFPKSTKWINYRLDRGMDYSFIASFTLSRNDIEKLFEKVEFEWSDSIRHVRNIEGEKWFKPDNIEKFKSFEKRYPKENTVLKVIYDSGQNLGIEQDVLFYIEWFELY